MATHVANERTLRSLRLLCQMWSFRGRANECIVVVKEETEHAVRAYEFRDSSHSRHYLTSRMLDS